MLQLRSSDDARRLYELLIEAGYSEQGLLQAFGTVDPPLPQLRNLPRLLDLSRRATRLDTLARWFLLGVPVSERQARQGLPDWFLELATQIELLRPDGDALHPTALLVPFGDRLIASDLFPQMESATHFDHVLTINPAARHLLDYTIRRPFRSALDLCTGCGIHALAAAVHCEGVVATDLNPRATAYTAFNARLNGFENVDSLTGDGFEPVEGRRFDLILCNPPFVLAPTRRYMYRDNSMELDQFCRMLVKEGPGYLNEGGYFQMICEWAEIGGEGWRQRIGEWFQDCGCDVWLLKEYSMDPSLYAQTRIRELPQDSAEADARTYSEWIAYYRAKGLQAVHGGLITMRKRQGQNWVRIDEVEEPAQGPFGAAIRQGFAGRDFLHRHRSDEALLEATPRLAASARLEEISRQAEGEWHQVSLRLRLSSGLPQGFGLDPGLARFLARLDGKHSVRQAVASLQATVDTQPAELCADCLKLVRVLIERGFLIPQ